MFCLKFIGESRSRCVFLKLLFTWFCESVEYDNLCIADGWKISKLTCVFISVLFRSSKGEEKYLACVDKYSDFSRCSRLVCLLSVVDYECVKGKCSVYRGLGTFSTNLTLRRVMTYGPRLPARILKGGCSREYSTCFVVSTTQRARRERERESGWGRTSQLDLAHPSPRWVADI